MLGQLKNPPRGFEDVVQVSTSVSSFSLPFIDISFVFQHTVSCVTCRQGHFSALGPAILAQCKQWTEEATSPENKQRFVEVVQALKVEIAGLRPVEPDAAVPAQAAPAQEAEPMAE